jgi:hypothetical protein
VFLTSWTEASSAAATSSPARLDTTNHLLAVLLAPGTWKRRLAVLPFLLFSLSCRTWTRSLTAGPRYEVLPPDLDTKSCRLAISPDLDTKSCRLAGPGHEVLPYRRLAILPSCRLAGNTGLHWTTRYIITHHCNLLQHQYNHELELDAISEQS